MSGVAASSPTEWRQISKLLISVKSIFRRESNMRKCLRFETNK